VKIRERDVVAVGKPVGIVVFALIFSLLGWGVPALLEHYTRRARAIWSVLAAAVPAVLRADRRPGGHLRHKGHAPWATLPRRDFADRRVDNAA
jgi:hypothetical protein